MGDPVTAGLIVGGASMAGSTYLSGRQSRNAYKTEAAQLKTQKQAMETNAAISQAERLNKLKTILASQNAAFAMGGQTAGAGTASVIQAASIGQANREQRYENLQTDVARSAYDYNIWSAKKASKLAMGTAIINSTLQLGKEIGGAALMAYSKKGGQNGNTQV